jgi:hypothetical protein
MSDDKANERSELWASEMDASDDKSPKDAKDTENTENEQSAWDTDSIRDDWHPNSVRLPKHLQDAWDAEHKRLDYELTKASIEIDYTKDRWYKPLVIALGLKALQSMDTEQVESALEEMQENEMVE